MNTKGVVGRRIVAVDQEWTPKEPSGIGGFWRIRRIRLDNGYALYFNVHEMDCDYEVEVGKVRMVNAVSTEEPARAGGES